MSGGSKLLIWVNFRAVPCRFLVVFFPVISDVNLDNVFCVKHLLKPLIAET